MEHTENYFSISVFVHWCVCAKHFWRNNFLCAPCFLLCARLTTCVRAYTRTA